MGSSGLPQSPAPALLSARRLTTLISSLVVSLSSGTNYVYSAYAPQLGSQLRMTHTQLNIVGLAGNVGVYSSAPILGKLVDRRGPKPLLAGAFIFLLLGYSGIRHFYDSATIPPAELHSNRASDESRLSTFGFCILVLCSFLTGAGGNGGLTSGMNATAKSFPDQMRASATALVISGFGLSAFFFSTIAHLFFPGDTSALLLLLALGTSFPMIMGFFLVRPIPLPSSSDAHHNHSRLPPSERRMSFAEAPSDGFSRTVVGDAMAYEHVAADSHTSLLSNHHQPDQHHPEEEDEEEEEEGAEGFTHHDHGSPNHDRSDGSVELAISPPPNARRHRSLSRVAGHRSSSRVIEVMHDISGKALFMGRDFWLLFFVLSFLSGTGLMYINNVGSISQALLAKDKPNYNEKEASKWQNMQVSTISIANCLGRILIGLCADVVKNKLNAPRSFCMTLVSLLFILSQLFATHVESVSGLWKASALLGLAYGGLFGLFPTIVIEWFGLAHFSENWGFVSLSPMFGGNLFSLAFGINLDKHATPSPSTSLPPSLASPSTATNVSLFTRAGLPSTQQCLDGRQCYTSSLHMTTFACSLALILSVYAGYRDMKRMRVPVGRSMRGPPEVIWDEDEEDG